MKPISQYLNPDLIEDLKLKVKSNFFEGIPFEQAMQFILTDGILPKSGLPAASFIKLENWLHSHAEDGVLNYTATDLKNKTGEILDHVLRGHRIKIIKHGREIAEIKKT